MNHALKILRDVVAEGFLLHGSSQRRNVLEPRQARDNDPTRWVRNQRAVYATDTVEIAVVMATLARKYTFRPWSSYYHFTTNDTTQSCRVGGKNVTFRSGWVHILAPNTFENIRDENESEIISRVPVRPVAVMQVNPPLVQLLGITVEFDYDPFAT